VSSQDCYLSTSCHSDSSEDITTSRQTSSLDLAKPNSLHNTDSSDHMCKTSNVLVQNCHTASVSLPSEDCSRDDINSDTSYTENNPELSNSCTQNSHPHQDRNAKFDTTSHKPPVLPRKVKNNKPPVPPRTLGPFTSCCTDDTTASSEAAPERQDEANPVHDGHQTQTKTHEMVVLRNHRRYVYNSFITT